MEEVSCLQPTLGGRDNLAPRWMELLFLLEVRGNPAEISSLSQPGLAKASFSRGQSPLGGVLHLHLKRETGTKAASGRLDFRIKFMNILNPNILFILIIQEM